MPKQPGPSLLCEWMVGTTIKSALGPPPKPPKPKAKRRDVIKLHVTTDDESGEDTLTVTYPRPERLREKNATPAEVPKTPEPQPEPESESEPEVVEVVKKVRFEKEAIPKKSALKKKTSVTFCEEEETSADATSTSASSGEATPDASSSNASSAAETSSAEETSSGSSSISAKPSKSTRSPKSKKVEKRVQSSDSEADSEPHPTCECKECASGRKKQGVTCEKKKCKKNDKNGGSKKKKEAESESETSVSGAESSVEEKSTPSKKSKEKKKEKKRAEFSSAEGETSESAKETEGESEVVVKKTPEKKKKNQESEKTEKAGKKTSSPKGEEKKKSDEEKKPEKEKEKEAEEAPSEKTPTGKGKEKEVDDTTPKAKDMDQRLHVSDGYHYTHSHPPNLIAPIRAEVMQTERVVETQDDPPPNAYYDGLHGVLRVYHGAVYGQNGHRMFAARENTMGPPQSFGNSNQTQNPYYHGYNNVMPMPLPQQQLPPHGYEHVPITQGLPIPGWSAMAPPPGYPPYNYQGPPPMPAAWYEQQLNGQGTKGTFSMYNGMGGTPDRKGKNKPREPDNNVMPEVTKSPFSNMGSNRSDGKPPSHSGQSNCSKNGNRDTGPNWDTASRRSVGAWANSSNHGATWGDGGGDTNNNNQGGGNQWGSGGGGGDTWGTTNNNNDQWDSNNNNNNSGADPWGAAGGNDQNNQGGWGTTDNGNNGGNTWGDGNGIDNQQTNDNNGNGSGQGQGQNSPAGGNDPPASMVDNNVIPVAAVTGPPGEQEQSKMPGSWCSDDNGQAAFVDPTWSSYQPPPAVPAWGDPSMAANTGGAVDW
ncbi:hypothetical protein CI102_12195 [Trichoderma harzianum]|uniref:Uncharacterized protein n=1 Tax=Trichoderma harzianum CBS 226.95 TaxID=983964 RepID=A0A2T4A3T8_TRIHA|nr:hypothetical protein M431DRAFT_522682 [Trichoderma harzianum CBS 226.95]PKK43123.1 hypothetical protein CI102_12195 [Trichoderma harzianum]PTB51716.1 hypothetical protein M431DRAFT_522682 [Trichoderma harzianum CBS 226.95]